MMIFCKKTECSWNQYMGNPRVHVCTRRGETLCLNEEGKCAFNNVIKKREQKEE